VSSGDDVNVNIIRDVQSQLDAKLKERKEPLNFLTTRYKQDNFFGNHELAVKPESVAFGTNFMSQEGTSRLVYKSFQYVSVQKKHSGA